MTAVELVGWGGNAFVFSRFLVQWIASERAGQSLATKSFWWLSLAGAVCTGIYASSVGEGVLLVGLVVNGLIYARNLWIAYDRGPRAIAPAILTPIAAVGIALLFWSGTLNAREDTSAPPFWLAVVIVGQTVWSTRFAVQWWFTERRGLSHFPRSFWWLSLFGNLLLLAYALHLGDAIFVAGFLLGPIVQVRNLMLMERASTGPPSRSMARPPAAMHAPRANRPC